MMNRLIKVNGIVKPLINAGVEEYTINDDDLIGNLIDILVFNNNNPINPVPIAAIHWEHSPDGYQLVHDFGVNNTDIVINLIPPSNLPNFDACITTLSQ